MNLTNISVSKIIPDANQPRKYFDEDKMGRLRTSIKTHGIKFPLKLEIQDDGTFIIVDGERRYRAAKELGLKEVPAILEPKQNDIQRLISQFHLQEMHQNWSPIEKAEAVGKLAETMSATIEEISKLLGLSSTNARDYMSFSRILDKKGLEKIRLPLRDIRYLDMLKGNVRKIAKENELEFGRTQEKQFENAVYTRIRNGEEIRKFYTKLKDSFRSDPKSIQQFVDNDEISTDKLFNQTKAYGTYYLRNIKTNATYLQSNIERFNKSKSAKVSKEVITTLKNTHRVVSDFIKEFEE